MTPTSPVVKGLERFERTYAKGQPQYLKLPALPSPSENGRILTRWRLDWRDKLRMVLTGDLYIEVLTFGKPLQPLRPASTRPAWAGEKRA